MHKKQNRMIIILSIYSPIPQRQVIKARKVSVDISVTSLTPSVLRIGPSERIKLIYCVVPLFFLDFPPPSRRICNIVISWLWFINSITNKLHVWDRVRWRKSLIEQLRISADQNLKITRYFTMNKEACGIDTSGHFSNMIFLFENIIF